MRSRTSARAETACLSPHCDHVYLAQHASRRAHRSCRSLYSTDKPPHARHGARPRRAVVREAGAISRLRLVAGTARRAARAVRQQAELAQPRKGHGGQARARHLHPRKLPLLLLLLSSSGAGPTSSRTALTCAIRSAGPAQPRREPAQARVQLRGPRRRRQGLHRAARAVERLHRRRALDVRPSLFNCCQTRAHDLSCAQGRQGRDGVGPRRV